MLRLSPRCREPPNRESGEADVRLLRRWLVCKSPSASRYCSVLWYRGGGGNSHEGGLNKPAPQRWREMPYGSPVPSLVYQPRMDNGWLSLSFSPSSVIGFLSTLQFISSKIASEAITLTIKQQFHEPWPIWGAIPKNDRDIFFQCFKSKVRWRPEHDHDIKKNFHSKAFHRLSEMFMEAQKNVRGRNRLGNVCGTVY
ncbi:hypothetical protein E2542_SST31583 [Spatholobus suberectus]|nr:hypothetical protein E2542_SST31583 [Spatholobus suberectus]